MKYLVIGSLIALLLLVVYSRIHPYLKAVKKILGTAKNITNTQSSGRAVRTRSSNDTRLVRCVGCGTWVPANRAVGAKASTSPYCSRECLEKSSTSDRRKAAS